MSPTADDSGPTPPLDATSPPLFDPATLEKVAGSLIWAEGPSWIRSRGVLRFSDVRSNRVLEFEEADGRCVEVTRHAEFTNGRANGPDGSVVECSHGRRAIQIDRHASDGGPYTPEVLVDRFGEARFNSPNDVVVHSDGSIWFTDPSYGITKSDEGYPGEEEYGDRYVFRFDPATGELTPVVIDVEAPNGLAFSPDERTLYVSDTSYSPGEEDDPDRARRGGHGIHAYDVFEGRHAKNGRLLLEVSPGAPDGFRVDVEGRIWSSSASGIQVFGVDGAKLAELPVPEVVANCCFGGADGRTLYICATTSIYRVRTSTHGATGP